MCDKPPKIFVLCHNMTYGKDLMDRFCHILRVLEIPFKRNTSQGNAVWVDNRAIFFCTFEHPQYEERGRDWNDVYTFTDHYRGR